MGSGPYVAGEIGSDTCNSPKHQVVKSGPTLSPLPCFNVRNQKLCHMNQNHLNSVLASENDKIFHSEQKRSLATC